jgi:hypothetical protein
MPMRRSSVLAVLLVALAGPGVAEIRMKPAEYASWKRYLEGRAPRAFATNGAGTWSWSEKAPTLEAAEGHALEECRKARGKGEPDCRIIDSQAD